MAQAPHMTVEVQSAANTCHRLRGVIHQFAESLGAAIDAKDPYIKNHSLEVAELAWLLARRLGLSREEAELVHIGGHLHDIGKIGVPDRILNKQGPLADDEWALMRRHPEIGAGILLPVQEIAASGIMDMVLHHHERHDGQGYPHGLAGQEIPIGARIITVADSLSAMLGQRTYRDPMRFETALAEIKDCAGSQFDPQVVRALVAASKEARDLLNDLQPSPTLPEGAAGRDISGGGPCPVCRFEGKTG